MVTDVMGKVGPRVNDGVWLARSQPLVPSGPIRTARFSPDRREQREILKPERFRLGERVELGLNATPPCSFRNVQRPLLTIAASSVPPWDSSPFPRSQRWGVRYPGGPGDPAAPINRGSPGVDCLQKRTVTGKGNSLHLVGPMGSICHQCCPLPTMKSAKAVAAGPRSPMG